MRCDLCKKLTTSFDLIKWPGLNPAIQYQEVCLKCSKQFWAWKEGKAEMPKSASLEDAIDCSFCEDKQELNGEPCEECCDHEFDPDEGFCCLNCGKDGTEDVMSAAYDRAKDFIKYGE